MKAPAVLGIDVGGTVIKLGIVRGSRVLLQRTLATQPYRRSPRRLENALVTAARSLMERFPGRVVGVGVGIPGLVRHPQGVVLSCANLPGWRGVNLKARLTRRLRLPVQVDNDVHAMTLAEWTCGAGRGVKNLLCLTLGTGVGGGILLNGSLYRSRLGPSAEIGHLPLGEEGPACPCGGRACLERYVGNREILEQVRRRIRQGTRSKITALVGRRLDRLTHADIDRACEKGDRLARQTWEEAGQRIGLALVHAIHLFCPDRIVIGGGIAKAGRWLFDPIRRTVRRRAMRGLGGVPIVRARLGSDAGLIGAALLGREAAG